MPRHKTYFPDEHTKQRLIDLRNAEVPMHRIERILKLDEMTMRRLYPSVFREKEKSGVRPWDPSPKELQQIEVMAGLGMNVNQIALVMGIPAKRLKTSVPDVIQRAAIMMDIKVGANLYKMATGDVTQKNTAAAAIWWTKARMGWRDTSRIETTGADGGPIQTQVQILLPDNGREDTPPMIDGKVEPADGEADQDQEPDQELGDDGDSDDAYDEATDEELETLPDDEADGTEDHNT